MVTVVQGSSHVHETVVAVSCLQLSYGVVGTASIFTQAGLSMLIHLVLLQESVQLALPLQHEREKHSRKQSVDYS